MRIAVSDEIPRPSCALPPGWFLLGRTTVCPGHLIELKINGLDAVEFL